MIDYHCFCQIKHLSAHQGLNAVPIARELTLDPRTVAYWLTQEHFRPRKARPRSSKLDPFKPEIGRLLDRYPYSAAQVEWAEIIAATRMRRGSSMIRA
jgi:hypothetical protein